MKCPLFKPLAKFDKKFYPADLIADAQKLIPNRSERKTHLSVLISNALDTNHAITDVRCDKPDNKIKHELRILHTMKVSISRTERKKKNERILKFFTNATGAMKFDIRITAVK